MGGLFIEIERVKKITVPFGPSACRLVISPLFQIAVFNDKMTILCNTQDGHFDVDLKELSSLKGHLVEAGGVEPPSENTSSGTSPGADGYLHSLTVTEAVILHGLVAS